MPQAYEELIATLRETALLASCAELLGWDEQTYMPAGGAEHRANQLSLLAGMVHERTTSPRIGELLDQVESELGGTAPDAPQAANVRETRRKFDRAARLPRRLVEELSKTTTLAQQAWVEARRNSNFRHFLPWLDKVIALKREEASAIGFEGGVPYDALLDEYEPGARTAEIQAVFEPLRAELVPLVAALQNAPRRPDPAILTRHYPVDDQREFALAAARAIGFDFTSGRLDEAAHPFCCGIGPRDCRLTTRYDEAHFPGAFFGTLHEAGHGIYDQGLEPEAFGLPMGQACSLGIHESQSRLWENFVGRSLAFWRWCFPLAQQAFPTALGGATLEQFHAAINDVRPSFIRVEADEVTYNLHIMLRFELEQALVAGSLLPADVPGAWNESFRRSFDLDPPSDALGCLQDIHWGAGLLGYFPTYALGNMYAAQLYNAAARELGDLEGQFARGEFQSLTQWLRTNIHRRGKQYPAPQLVEVVTGERLSHRPLMDHLRQKYGTVYGL